MSTDPVATLTPTMRALLLNAQQDGTTIYRGGLDIENGCAPASTLRALAVRGLVELKIARIQHYSRAGTHYRGTWNELDAAKLTDAGHALRLALLAEQ